jgi:MOSC domain-containing protein YiiM
MIAHIGVAYFLRSCRRTRECLGNSRSSAWLPNGFFGENLTTAGISVNDTLVGERWRVGADVIPEASCPRIPCATFQGWLGRTGWIKRFTEAAVPGAFLRVIEPGDIRAGHPVETVSRPAHDVTIALVFRTVTLEPDLLPRLLTAEALAAEITEQDRRRLSA